MCVRAHFLVAVVATLLLEGAQGDQPHDLQRQVGKTLPDFYALDNIFDCLKQGHVYCELKVTYRPLKNDSAIWRYIQASKDDKYKFHKDKAYRAMCVAGVTEATHRDAISHVVKRKFDEELLNSTELQVQDVTLYECRNTVEKSTPMQKSLIRGFLIYLAFIVFATAYHVLSERQGVKPANKYLLAFSLVANNAKLRKPIQNPHYARLKSMQGIRTYNTVMVVMGHAILNFFIMFVSNPEFIEHITSTPIKLFFTWGMFLVQPFFMITGWLTMVFFMDYAKKKDIGFKDMAGALVLRVLRLWPTLIFSLIIHASGIIPVYYQGGLHYILQRDVNICKERWWSTLFFFGNFYDVTEMCNLASWYLSADLQIFLGTLVSLLIIFRFKLPVQTSLIALFSLVTFVQFTIMYLKDLDVIYRVLPENFLFYKLIEQENVQVNLWYISALSNAPSFIVGMLFGVFSYRNPDKHYFRGVFGYIVWFSIFFGIPFLSIYLGTQSYGRFGSAFMGSLLKPMYSFGIAVGILGMSQGVGGIIKRVCEWNVAQHVSPVTYSVYLNHVFFVFEPILTATTTVEMSWIKMIIGSIKAISKSFLIGYINTHLIDYPWNNVRNLIMGGSKTKADKED